MNKAPIIRPGHSRPTTPAGLGAIYRYILSSEWGKREVQELRDLQALETEVRALFEFTDPPQEAGDVHQ